MILGLTLISCPEIAGWVLVSTGQNGVRGHDHLVLYTWHCVHSHILVFSGGCIQWTCLKIEQRWKPESSEPATCTKSDIESLDTGHSLTTNLISSAQEWVGSDCEWGCSSVWMAQPRAICLYSTAHDCFRKCVGMCCSQALTSKI